MGSLESLLAAMDELAIASDVGIPHDEARMNYSLNRNTVGSFGEFADVIADYYNYHISQCVLHGGFLSNTEASGRAKEILVQEYKRQGGSGQQPQPVCSLHSAHLVLLSLVRPSSAVSFSARRAWVTEVR